MRPTHFASPRWSRFVVVAPLVFSTMAHAHDTFWTPAEEFGNVLIEGTGCVEKITATAQTGRSIGLDFAKGSVAVSATDRMALLRCHVQIPLHVPAGFQVRWEAGQWSGVAASFGRYDSATLSVKTFFGGREDAPGSAARTLTQADAATSFGWTLPVNSPAQAWSDCGRDATLTLIIHAQLRAPLIPDSTGGGGMRPVPETRPLPSLELGALTLPALTYRRCTEPQ